MTPVLQLFFLPLGWYSFLISSPTENKRLSLPEWLVPYQDGMSANDYPFSCYPGSSHSKFVECAVMMPLGQTARNGI